MIGSLRTTSCPRICCSERILIDQTFPSDRKPLWRILRSGLTGKYARISGFERFPISRNRLIGKRSRGPLTATAIKTRFIGDAGLYRVRMALTSPRTARQCDSWRKPASRPDAGGSDARQRLLAGPRRNPPGARRHIARRLPCIILQRIGQHGGKARRFGG